MKWMPWLVIVLLLGGALHAKVQVGKAAAQRYFESDRKRFARPHFFLLGGSSLGEFKISLSVFQWSVVDVPLRLRQNILEEDRSPEGGLGIQYPRVEKGFPVYLGAMILSDSTGTVSPELNLGVRFLRALSWAGLFLEVTGYQDRPASVAGGWVVQF